MTNPPQLGATYDEPKEVFRDSASPRLSKERLHLYLWCLFRLVVTLLLLGIVAVLLKGFSEKDAITRSQKYAFNTSILLLTLALGLNTNIVHSQIVNFIQEGITNRKSSDDKYWTFRKIPQFKDITGLRSTLIFLSHIVSAGAPTYPGGVAAASVFCSVWFFFSLCIAVIIALIGLTYSIDEGGIGYRTGSVSIVNPLWLTLKLNLTDPPDVWSQRFVSRLYTDISISYEETNHDDPGPPDQYQVEKFGDGWRYNFRESDPARKVMIRSKRYITTSATCTAYPIQSFNQTVLEYNLGDGTIGTLENYILDRDTSYISQVVDISDLTSPNKACGPRCGHLIVTQIPDITVVHDAYIYFCESTVHQVGDTQVPEESISDQIALLAATSLSQSGFIDFYGGLYGYYPKNVLFGTNVHGNAQEMATLLSRASIGCIAAMDEMNPRVLVPGTEPWVGGKLKVQWLRLQIVLVAIFLIQLIFSLCAVLWHHMNCDFQSLATSDPSLDPTPPSPSGKKF